MTDSLFVISVFLEASAMSTDWRAGLGKFAITIDLGAITVPSWESMVSAQIIPDETLGAESSKERQDILLLTSLLTEVLPHKIKTTKRDRHFAILSSKIRIQ